MRRELSILVGAVVAATSLVACGGGGGGGGTTPPPPPPPGDTGSVRVVNGFSSAPTANFFAGTTAIPTGGAGVANGATSPYTSVPVGLQTISAQVPGNTTFASLASQTVAKDKFYTAVGYGAGVPGNATAFAYLDDSAPVAPDPLITSGTIGIRLLNGARAVGAALQVYLTAPGASVTGLTPDVPVLVIGGQTIYIPWTVTGGSTNNQVQVRAWKFSDPTTGPPLAAGTVTLNDAGRATVIFLDNPGGASQQTVVLQDSP